MNRLLLVLVLLAAPAWGGLTSEWAIVAMSVGSPCVVTNGSSIGPELAWAPIESLESLLRCRCPLSQTISNVTISTTVVTNGPIETDNAWICRKCSPDPTWPRSNITTLEYHDPVVCIKRTPATERTRTTTVVERKTLAFDWDGQRHEVVHERVLSEERLKSDLKLEWSEWK